MLDAAKKAGIPVFGSEIEQVKNGCVATEGLDYVALGKQTGEMAAKVLAGEAHRTYLSKLFLNTAFTLTLLLLKTLIWSVQQTLLLQLLKQNNQKKKLLGEFLCH